MKNEINKDFYCSADVFNTKGTDVENSYCRYADTRCKVDYCQNHRRKHPTPEQYKNEYGEEYHDDWAVYVDYTDKYGVHYVWNIDTFGAAKNYLANKENKNFFMVCVCTPFGRPDDDWRPK